MQNIFEGREKREPVMESYMFRSQIRVQSVGGVKLERDKSPIHQGVLSKGFMIGKGGEKVHIVANTSEKACGVINICFRIRRSGILGLKKTGRTRGNIPWSWNCHFYIEYRTCGSIYALSFCTAKYCLQSQEFLV